MRTTLLAALLAAILTIGLVPTVQANARIDSGTNAFRSSHGLPALTTWGPLEDVARRRAREITSNFAHPTNWQYLFDLLPGCLTGIGENIAYSTTSVYSDAWVVNAWIDSPSHRANMLGTWSWQGSATYVANDGRTYAVQLFALGCTETTQPKPQPQVRTSKPAPAPTAPPARPAPKATVQTMSLPDTAMGQ